MGSKIKKAMQLAETQAGLNKDTAVTQAEMNMVNQVGPQGTTTYSQTGTSASGNPQYTVTQTLSPTQQALQNQKDALSKSTLGNANTTLGTAANFGTAPTLEAPTLQTGAGGTQIGTDFQSASLDPNFQNSALGTDFTKQGENKIYDLGKQRLDPRFEQERQTLESSLAERGIRPGMEAYDRAIMSFEQSKNDAYNQLMLTGLETAAGISSNEFQAGLSQNQFNSGQLDAANQTKLLQAGISNEQMQLINQGKIQQVAADLQKQTADNAAKLQQAQASNDAAQTQFLTQQQTELMKRQQAIQEAQAATTMGQVAPIGTVNTPQTGVQGTDMLGTWNNLNAQANAQQNALMGGIGSLAGTAGSVASTYLMSDKRLKTDTKKVGKLNDGTPVHAYRYKGSPMMQLGVMAQEAEKNHPKAVARTRRGLMAVDYGRLAREVA